MDPFVRLNNHKQALVFMRGGSADENTFDLPLGGCVGSPLHTIETIWR